MTADILKGLVLVTGANGYIAGHVIDALLKSGYAVRGTVRSRPSGDGLCKALHQYANNLEIVEVPDITVDGAFDSAANGTTSVIHIAAPVNIFKAEPEAFMHASLEGLAQALKAAENGQATVKSFIFMSSVASIFSEREDDHTFTEADWNTYSERIVAEKANDTPKHVIYEASKVAAERAMWKFREERKPRFSVTAVNPILCAGPSIVPPSSPEQIHISTKMIWNVFAGEPLEKAAIPGVYQGYVDVRDVARLVLFAVENTDKTDNERFILARYYCPPQAVADILRKSYPGRSGIIEEGRFREGYNKGYEWPGRIAYDGSKVVRVTGSEYTPWETTVVDTAESLRHLV